LESGLESDLESGEELGAVPDFVASCAAKARVNINVIINIYDLPIELAKVSKDKISAKLLNNFIFKRKDKK
jgi:hypothetical protein